MLGKKITMNVDLDTQLLLRIQSCPVLLSDAPLDTLEKLNIISTVRGRSGKSYKVNEIFLKSESDGSILYTPKSNMYKKDHSYVKKRSVLVEALTLSNIDKIVGTYKGDKESIIDHLAKLPPEELMMDTKNPYYVKLAINKKNELAAEVNKNYVHPQKIINELTKIKKQSNPRYREKGCNLIKEII